MDFQQSSAQLKIALIMLSLLDQVQDYQLKLILNTDKVLKALIVSNNQS